MNYEPYNRPIKVIHKYKNMERFVQYNIYIFVGQKRPILDKIKNLNFYDTLLILTEIELKKLEEYYGNNWYTYFFNSYHLKDSKYKIRTISEYKNKITNKLGKQWYKSHIDNIDTLLTYSYETKLKKDLMISKQDIQLKEVLIDYTTLQKQSGGIALQKQSGGIALQKQSGGIALQKQSGGTEEDVELDFELKEAEIDMKHHHEINGNIEDEEVNLDELTIDDEEIKVDTDETSGELKKTTDMINKLLEKNKIKKEPEKQINEENINKTHDTQLKDVYNKIYIIGTYIYDDDTINTIKKKICYNVANSRVFIGDKQHVSYIAPSRQHLWIEYDYNENNKIIRKKIMAGKKWIVKNELINIDIEPNTNTAIYENLKNNLRLLKENIKKYGSKIKYKVEDNYILRDYEEFFSNNEIYFVDIYNELGVNYQFDNEKFINLYSVYSKIYFFDITQDELKNIINYLDLSSNNRSTEINFFNTKYQNIRNELLLDTEIMNLVETTKKEYKSFKNIFLDQYITHCVIYIYLKIHSVKLNLFKLYDNFIVNDKYPFMQYKRKNDNMVFKSIYDKEKVKTATLEEQQLVYAKWYETAPYGISIKVKLSKHKNKYLSISIYENGRLEYKSQWKEEDNITLEDVYETINEVKDLLNKFLKENKDIKIDIPQLSDFKFAFINVTQKFQLTTDNKLKYKYSINHNDLSDFVRYFYPYIALIIEPRKRISKKQNEAFSKYGTYLRYKRISNYEDSEKIENIILYYIKNYEFTDQLLINELAKQFNITEEDAKQKYEFVKKKHPSIKKSRKVLKKIDTLPKYKTSGIDINIQGKTIDQYKIKIAGIKSEKMLQDITILLNIIMYLYIETYIKKTRTDIKDKLKSLVNIAKRKHKVIEYVMKDTDGEITGIKELIKLDKDRLGFKPEKGHNQWSRSCQKSGLMNKQPQIINAQNEEILLKNGYILNKETDEYEKKVKYKGKEHTLTAIKLKNSDNDNLYYTCDPGINKEYMYIGFLTKSDNPNELCMPCCFKKNQREADNIQKKNFYFNCINTNYKKKFNTTSENEKLYILQYHNKIIDDRFSFLPEQLDMLINKINNLTYIIHNYYLQYTNKYYLLYGSLQNENNFLNCIATSLNISLNELKLKLINKLKEDKHEQLFIALNNGDIKTIFNNIDTFINYINNNQLIDESYLQDLINIPNILTKLGINLLIFEKRMTTVLVENIYQTKENYVLLCGNTENLLDIDKDYLIILKDDKSYYPIYEVNKDKDIKTLNITKILQKNHIINRILDYYKIRCTNLIDTNAITSKKLYLELTSKNIKVIGQSIDIRNKCKYLLTDNKLILPVHISGTLYNIKIIDNLINYYKDINPTIEEFMTINTKLGNIYKINGVFYDHKENDKYKIVSISLKYNLTIPIKHTYLSQDEINKMFKKYNLKYYILDFRPLYEHIDKILLKTDYIPDRRTDNINYEKYKEETYELLRLELSNYFKNHPDITKKILNIVSNLKTDINTRRDSVHKIMKNIIKNEFNIFKNKKLFENYIISNHRMLCKDINNQYHCDNDKFKIYNEFVEIFIYKTTEEMIMYDTKTFEILNIDDYYVTDVVDFNNFTEREKQKIISSTNIKKNQILGELFGTENIPTIGKQFNKEEVDIDLDKESIILQTYGDIYIQRIIPNNNTIYRAIANNYYWLKNKLYHINIRNLGYFDTIQTNLSNYFKSKVIEWLSYKKNVEKLQKLDKSFNMNYLDKYKLEILKTSDIKSEHIIELFILHKILKLNIIIYNNYNNIIFTIINKEIKKYDGKTDINLPIELLKESINIKYIYVYGNKYPTYIEVIYNK